MSGYGLNYFNFCSIKYSNFSELKHEIVFQSVKSTLCSKLKACDCCDGGVKINLHIVPQEHMAEIRNAKYKTLPGCCYRWQHRTPLCPCLAGLNKHSPGVIPYTDLTD